MMIIGLWFTHLGMAQSFRVGILPTVNINKKWENGWEGHFKVESRQYLAQWNDSQAARFSYRYSLTDLSCLAGFKTGLYSKVMAGYLIRVEGDGVMHRIMQQWSLIQPARTLRWAHRLALDQTFSHAESIAFRFRYRIGLEIPLQGESLNQGEIYFKMQHEHLHRLQGRSYDLELRLAPVIGLYISDVSKMELGLDYRLDSFIHHDFRHTFLFNVNWYGSI
jgi:hypothetical protein